MSNQGGKAALCQMALTDSESIYMTRSFPLAGRADGENEKSRMTVKNLPIPTTQKPTRILRSCGIRKTSLRQRLHSTATLFG